MSLERYFQRAQDEARAQVRISEKTGGDGVLYEAPRWLVALLWEDRRNVWCKVWRTRARTAERAERDVRRHPLSAGATVAWIARVPPLWLDGILDRAMVDTDGRPTLAPGEGAEARRLLAMVAWDRVPHARWPEVFEVLSAMAASGHIRSQEWEDWLCRWIDAEGLAASERPAA